jgi:hypothetical protein
MLHLSHIHIINGELFWLMHQTYMPEPVVLLSFQLKLLTFILLFNIFGTNRGKLINTYNYENFKLDWLDIGSNRGPDNNICRDLRNPGQEPFRL